MSNDEEVEDLVDVINDQNYEDNGMDLDELD